MEPSYTKSELAEICLKSKWLWEGLRRYFTRSLGEWLLAFDVTSSANGWERQQSFRRNGGESGIVLAANSKITLKMQKSIYRPAIAVI
jgi:hypothetical protein